MRRVLPPVFVMNLYYTGIGIARNLAGMGVDVYGLSSESDAPGVRSRFFKSLYRVPNGRDEPEALCRRLLEIKNSYTQAPVIFPTRDVDVLFLHDYRKQLEPFYRLPADKGIMTLLDKSAMAREAEAQEIPVPAIALCNSIEDIEEAIVRLGFPLVVKPRFAYHWRRDKAWQAVGARKAFLVESVEELLKEYARLVPVSQEVLLQEYVSGSDNDIVVCGCYIGQSGALLGYFTSKKLLQNPPLFGTGCVIEAVQIPPIVSLATKLLRACGYIGLAEVEFKHDRAADKFYLIEANPRHWDQHELGRHLGVNLTNIAYQDMVGLAAKPQVPTYDLSRSCKWVAEQETCMLLLHQIYSDIQPPLPPAQATKKLAIGRVFAAVRKVLVEARFVLRGRKLFGIFDWRDPLPGVFLFLRLTRELAHMFACYVAHSRRARRAGIDSLVPATRR